MAETNVKTETTEKTAKVTEKTAARRAKEKELRATVKPVLTLTSKVHVITPDPKRPTSKAHAVFSRYVGEPTVGSLFDLAAKGEIKAPNGEVVDAGYVRACLAWDIRHGFISLIA